MYGEKVDAIDYYDSEIDRLTEEVPAFLFQVLCFAATPGP
jgi:hypothetical protein